MTGLGQDAGPRPTWAVAVVYGVGHAQPGATLYAFVPALMRLCGDRLTSYDLQEW